MRESAPGMIEVAVPDSYENFRRVLLFIYTGFIDAPDQQAVVDALIAADRYSLPQMKLVRSFFMIFLRLYFCTNFLCLYHGYRYAPILL
jgi:hypothetical protein